MLLYYCKIGGTEQAVSSPIEVKKCEYGKNGGSINWCPQVLQRWMNARRGGFPIKMDGKILGPGERSPKI
jgi:hypothetical protein